MGRAGLFDQKDGDAERERDGDDERDDGEHQRAVDKGERAELALDRIPVAPRQKAPAELFNREARIRRHRDDHRSDDEEYDERAEKEHDTKQRIAPAARRRESAPPVPTARTRAIFVGR